MKEIKDRLSEALRIRDITRSELSDLSGVPKPMITDYLKGRYKPKQNNIYALSKALRVNPAWLLGYEDADTDDLSYLERPVSVSDLSEKYTNIRPVTRTRVPMLGKIACGQPIYADEDHESFVEVGTDLHADFCLTCSGDSMEPLIKNGDIVFIRETPQVENGQIAAVIIDDEATLKRVYYDQNANRLTLVAENTRYMPLVYVGAELENVRILGRAVSIYRKI